MAAFLALPKRLRLLDDDLVLCPPSEDFGYQSTPKNALTFADMGVDGVHYSILKRDGKIRDDSPVIQVSPMDSEDITVLAESFLHYLSDGCGVTMQEMEAIFEAERTSHSRLVPFLSQNFKCRRLLKEERAKELTLRFGNLIERKVASPG